MTFPATIRRRSTEWLPPFAVFVGAIILWEVLFLALDVKSFLIPRPTVIWGALKANWPTLWHGITYTGSEAVFGLAAGVTLGTLAGLATGRWATARQALVPIGTGMSTIPIIAFA